MDYAKIFGTLFVVLILGLCIFGLSKVEVPSPETQIADETTRLQSSDRSFPDREAGGLGMTYGGKLGIQLSPFLVIPFDGSGLNVGFGF
jgi:hypothetical protein